jgi:hypothetical protein
VAFATSELPDNQELASCCGESLNKEKLEEFARSMTGKVWSAKIYAKKPGGACCG